MRHEIKRYCFVAREFLFDGRGHHSRRAKLLLLRARGKRRTAHLLPCGERVAVRLVKRRDAHAARVARVVECQRQLFRRAGVFRLKIIPHGDDQ